MDNPIPSDHLESPEPPLSTSLPNVSLSESQRNRSGAFLVAEMDDDPQSSEEGSATSSTEGEEEETETQEDHKKEEDEVPLEEKDEKDVTHEEEVRPANLHTDEDGGVDITRKPKKRVRDEKKVVNDDDEVVVESRKMRFPASKVEELPKELKRLVKSSKVPDEVFDRHFPVLLNILQFTTKKVFLSSLAATTPGASPSPRPASSALHRPISPSGDRPLSSSQTISTSTKRGAFLGGFFTNFFKDSEDKTPKKSQEEKGHSLKKSSDQLKEDSKKSSEEKLQKKPSDDQLHKKPAEDKPPKKSDEIQVKDDVTKEPEEPQVSKGQSEEEKKEEPHPKDHEKIRQSERKEEAKQIVKESKIAPKHESKEKNILSSFDAMFIQHNPKDKFKGIKKAGRGGFGTVFAARSANDNTKVAIKRVRHSTTREKMDNFNEMRYLKMCRHPNIVKLIECYEWKEECWMVMEFMEGGTLTEARRGHEFEEKEVAFVARELLKALSYIHSLHLVHRDLKSENIMMSIMGDVKLIDFGLCTDASLIKPCMVGSPYWMPPEMINRRKHSYPADMWSFGVSLLELCNKSPPNAQNKIKAMFTAATVGFPNPLDEPKKWSPDFKDFIGKCLEFRPSKRGTAEELLQHPFIGQAANTRKGMRKILSEVFLQRAIGLM